MMRDENLLHEYTRLKHSVNKMYSMSSTYLPGKVRALNFEIEYT